MDNLRREQFRAKEIRELENIRSHCRLTLRNGPMLLAWLNADRSLRLDEIDGVC